MTDESFSSMAEVVRQLMDKTLGQSLSDNQRAARSWNEANGDIERAHTTGVYLRAARKGAAAPVLIVYLDSRMRVVDFGANKEIYLERLRYQGLELSDIDFRESKSRPAYGQKEVSQAERPPEPLPELAPEEREMIRKMIGDLPESLQDAAFEAVSASLRRERITNHAN